MRWFPLQHINLDALLLALAIVQITLILAIAAWGLRRRYLGDKTPAPIFKSLCGAALALFVIGTLVVIAEDPDATAEAGCDAAQC
jgi:hypothetical protein